MEYALLGVIALLVIAAGYWIYRAGVSKQNEEALKVANNAATDRANDMNRALVEEAQSAAREDRRNGAQVVRDGDAGAAVELLRTNTRNKGSNGN